MYPAKLCLPIGGSAKFKSSVFCSLVNLTCNTTFLTPMLFCGCICLHELVSLPEIVYQLYLSCSTNDTTIVRVPVPGM